MLDISLALLLGFLVLAFGLWYKHRRHVLGTFKRLNIPGPEPSFLFGNMWEFKKKGPRKVHQDWSQKYGKVYGYFFGAKPIIVVGDAELLRQIQVKDFQKFINRPRLIPGGLQTSKIFKMHLLRQRDQKWKNMRAILTPSFTSGKMKQMAPILNDSFEEFISGVEKHNKANEEFDIYAMYKALTLDVIGRTAFGIKSGVQKNPETDEFLLAVQDTVTEDHLSGTVLLSICFPEFLLALYPFRLLFQVLRNLLGKSRLAELAERCHAILRSRRENPKNRRLDLMQLMLDAQLSQTDLNKSTAESLTAGQDGDLSSPEPHAREAGQKAVYHMNDLEILSNIFVILFAGFDTTSTALGFSTHELVNRQDIQDKIREEIVKVFEKDGFLDFANVSKCKYLDQFMNESLRYYPPVAGFIGRECASDVTYNDLTIPKGIIVQIPININRDPDYWTDPETFDPERFSPENKRNIHPMAFQTFGAGPRNCIGMRFAHMEYKLALANLLLKYRLIPGQKTERDNIEIVFKLSLMNPKNGVFVKAEKIRN